MTAGDLPPGKWTAALIGPWWPGDSSALRGGETHWGTQSAAQESFSQDLSNKAKELGRNTGTTASDLISRFESGATFHLDLAEKYQEKKLAFGKGAGAIDTLRSGLKGIAQEYNAKIDQIANSQISPVLKLSQITGLITEANGQAAFKSASAVTTILDAVQQILTAEGMSMSAQEFLGNQGLSTEPPKPPDASKAAAEGLGLGGDPAVGGQGVGGDGPPGAEGSELGNHVPGGSGPAVGGQGQGGIPGGSSGGPIGIGSPGGSGGQLPGSGGLSGPSLPGGGQLSPAAALGKGLSPDSLSQSFTQGMTSGQPLAAGAHSLSAGTMNAVEAGSASPPQAPPPAQMAPPPMVAPTAAGGGGGFESAGAEHGSAGAPVASSGPATAAPMGPAVVAGPVAPPPAAPVMGGAPAAPAGPLPGYGADLLRTPPAVPPPISAGPVGGAPAAPVSPASSPSAGGPLVSPVDRSGAAAAGAQAGSNSPAAGAAAMAAAGTGAAAGSASDIAGEQKRLQRIVDVVARQEPRLTWAACVRDDGTTVLATDLAGGWIPPHVELPVGVDRLLEPAERRADLDVLGLLGGYKTAVVYQPHTYISEPDSDSPALSAGVRLRKVAPIDDFGPTLVDALTGREGLPRMASTLAKATLRNEGRAENDIEAMRADAAAIPGRVLATYPSVAEKDVVDWMLMGAVDALLDGHPSVAQYHFAWVQGVTMKARR